MSYKCFYDINSWLGERWTIDKICRNDVYGSEFSKIIRLQELFPYKYQTAQYEDSKQEEVEKKNG